MDSNSTLVTGIAPEHISAAIAALLLVPGIWVGMRVVRILARRGSDRASYLMTRWEAVTFARRLTAVLLLATAVIHLALPISHADAGVLNLMYLASGAALLVVAVSSLGEGAWRLKASLLLTANVISYLVVAGSGWLEEPDQVGIATKFIELTALGLIVIPRLEPAQGIRRRLKRPAASLGFVALTVATGLRSGSDPSSRTVSLVRRLTRTTVTTSRLAPRRRHHATARYRGADS